MTQRQAIECVYEPLKYLAGKQLLKREGRMFGLAKATHLGANCLRRPSL